jgi:hypothetical protein
MQNLIDVILRFGSAELATEAAACDALVAVRFPNGVCCPCGAMCRRVEAHVTCARNHRFTILVGTPLASKRKPRVRALFIALRLLATSPRSVPARELARDLGVPHVSLWRHLHTLRALLPPQRAVPTELAAVVHLCRGEQPASIRAAVASATSRVITTSNGGRVGRLVGENIRTLINGTFRGVSAHWLPSYLAEAMTRWRLRDGLVRVILARMLSNEPPLFFAHVAARGALVSFGAG